MSEFMLGLLLGMIWNWVQTYLLDRHFKPQFDRHKKVMEAFAQLKEDQNSEMRAALYEIALLAAVCGNDVITKRINKAFDAMHLLYQKTEIATLEEKDVIHK